MKTEEAIEIIYEAMKKTVGKEKARSALSATISCMFYDLEESGKGFSAENLREAILEEAKFCIECMKKDVA